MIDHIYPPGPQSPPSSFPQPAPISTLWFFKKLKPTPSFVIYSFSVCLGQGMRVPWLTWETKESLGTEVSAFTVRGWTPLARVDRKCLYLPSHLILTLKLCPPPSPNF